MDSDTQSNRAKLAKARVAGFFAHWPVKTDSDKVSEHLIGYSIGNEFPELARRR
jgi:hypothetical protein